MPTHVILLIRGLHVRIVNAVTGELLRQLNLGLYRNPEGKQRSAGSYASRREALRAANREEQKVYTGSWHDATLGRITLKQYVQNE